ncbi:hypothetical protein [Paucilactobacillus wasatchensis]|uniref:hypothetical protein n=1 Tax=Paucilactobacillus wasatchensis TaxID=1335616 RepID=UPI0005C735B6|nr:hypothetical protein [Paucilactobacillus wasatchensis]
MNIIELVLGALIELISFSVPDLLFGLPRMRLKKKITKKANSLSFSAIKLNELARKPEYTITDGRSGGFDFSGCSYHELKLLWRTIQ